MVILAEFALLFYLLFSAYEYSAIALAIMVIADYVAVISLINRDSNPEYKVSWLTVLMLLSPFGVVLYKFARDAVCNFGTDGFGFS